LADIPYPYVIRPGELIRKVMLIRFEVTCDRFLQAVFLSKRLAGGEYNCCYHIGELVGTSFKPHTAECLDAPDEAAVDRRLDALLSGVRAALEQKFEGGRYVGHTVHDLSAIPTVDEQLAYLESKGLGGVAVTRP